MIQIKEIVADALQVKIEDGKWIVLRRYSSQLSEDERCSLCFVNNHSVVDIRSEKRVEICFMCPDNSYFEAD